MKKIIVSLLVGSIFASSMSFSTVGSFSFAVNIENNFSDLAVTEISTIKSPTILVNESTSIGAKCYTNHDSGDTFRGLCLNTTPNTINRRAGTYLITGTPLGAFTAFLSAPVTVNGLKFTSSFSVSGAVLTSRNSFLDDSGKRTLSVPGRLELMVDQVGVTRGSTIFTLDITVNYT